MSLELDKQKTIQMRTNRHKIQRGYSTPFVRLIELESEAPLLAGSIDVLMGDTGNHTGTQDYVIDDNDIITFP